MLKDFVSRLDLDIMEESHDDKINFIEVEAPSSYVTSKYMISNAPDEVKDRLRALYPIGDTWHEYSEGALIGDVPTENVSYLLRETIRGMTSFPSGLSLVVNEEQPLDAVLVLICPWLLSGEDTYDTLYPDVIILTEEGILITRSHFSGWNRCHAKKVEYGGPR